MKFFNNFRLGLDKEYKDALAIAAVLGLHMASGAIVGIVMGHYLDKWLDTAPWLLIAMTLLGIAAGFKNVIKDTKLLMRKVNEADATKFSGDHEGDDGNASAPRLTGGLETPQAGADKNDHETDT